MSTEFTPKNLRQPISCYEESTWTANGSPIWENDQLAVWADKFPCTPGHTLFIPKKDDQEHIMIAYGCAYQWAKQQVNEKLWDGFNIGQNIGDAAGQTIYWPHIHVIPRHTGDSKDKGGIRRAHPNADNKAYY